MLTDFGACPAVTARKPKGHKPRSQTQVLGTPGFMAPGSSPVAVLGSHEQIFSPSGRYSSILSTAEHYAAKGIDDCLNGKTWKLRRSSAL
ncbi:MAG: hypothetical protein R3C68_19565 [Myxococcota bacterium]